MVGLRMFTAVLIVGAFAILFAFVMVAPGGDRSLLDLSPQAASAYNERAQMEHAEEMARIEAGRETRDRVLVLVGVLGVAGIVAFAVAGRKPAPTITVHLPPHIAPDRIEEFWAAQDRIMEVRGYLSEPRR